MKQVSIELEQFAKRKQVGELMLGSRVPHEYFLTSGMGESDITVHAGSYHLALNDAGIERCNIMVYSSTLPGTAVEVAKSENFPHNLTHGAVMETIMACANGTKGVRTTAAIIYGWLYRKVTGERYGGLVCEYNGSGTERESHESLKKSLNELYTNGYDKDYDLRDVTFHARSFVPQKQFGTALVALCFLNHTYPVLEFKK